MKLADIVKSGLAVFKTIVSKVLYNGKVDEWEFGMLQTVCFKVLNELTGVDHKMGTENRNQFEKSLLKEINDIKNTLKTTRAL